MESHHSQKFLIVIKLNVFYLLLLVLLLSYLRNRGMIQGYKDLYLCFLFVGTSFIFQVSLKFWCLKLSSIHNCLSLFFFCFPSLCLQVFEPLVFSMFSFLASRPSQPFQQSTNNLLSFTTILPPHSPSGSTPLLFILHAGAPALMWHFLHLPVVKELLS